MQNTDEAMTDEHVENEAATGSRQVGDRNGWPPAEPTVNAGLAQPGLQPPVGQQRAAAVGSQARAASRAPVPYQATPSSVLNDFPTPLVESLRYVIGRFQLGEHDSFPSRLAVTSALHGEGVTTISRTLSAIIAHDLDRRVCWVDLSWRGAPVGRDREEAVGITDVLTGNAALADALQPTEDPRLTMLTSGGVAPGQRDAFSRSTALGSMLDELAEQFTSIVFDTPPVLAGSTGLTQMRHANAYLLVVRHGVTSQQQVRMATDELKAVPSMGVVLNQYGTKIPKRLTHFFVS